MKRCAWCGRLLSDAAEKDGRYKYCSVECANERKKEYNRRYMEEHYDELEKYRRQWLSKKNKMSQGF